MTLLIGPIDFGTKTSKRGQRRASTMRVGDVLGRDVLDPAGLLQARPPARCSRTPGITQETSIGVSRSSPRSASLTPTTKCLVPQ